MNKVTESLASVNNLVKKDITEQLAISQVSGENYNKETHEFLEVTLKMTNCLATQELRDKRHAIEVTSLKKDVLAEFDLIQKEFGEKMILDYKGLVQLCNENDLYYGHTPLFCGNMPQEALDEAAKFNFARARTILRVGRQKEGEPIVEWDYDNGSYYDLVVVAPITMFKLNSPNKVLISQREIIEHPYGGSNKGKASCTEHDPVLLLPFRSKDRKIYFIVITNW